MEKKCCSAFAWLLIWCGFCSSALAHSPYFGQSEKIEHADFGVVTFAILYGDGIFFADPSQVVVYDDSGSLLAATSQSEALLIRCERSADWPICFVYDELRGVVIEPDFEQWARGRTIEGDGRPHGDAYPEYMDIEYGFTERPASFMERVEFEAIGVINSPIASLLAVLWWCAAWSFVSRIFWRWKRHGWQIFPVNGLPVVQGVLSTLAFLGMSFLAAYAWLLEPYSIIFFAFAFILGALLAAALTRPKAAVQDG